MQAGLRVGLSQGPAIDQTLCTLQLLVAFPAGWLADHMRRDRVLRIAAALGAIAGCALLTALVLQLDVTYLFLAAALLGVYRGFNNPALESIYADSVPTGQRYGSTSCLLHWMSSIRMCWAYVGILFI